MRNKLQPYVGPRPFERGDQALFFGRDREARDLLSLVVAHEAVLLYAQSGAGKTSLLNAMLIPFLEEKGFQVLPTARVRGSIPEGIEPDQIPNLYVLNTLVSWAGDESQPEDLARMSLAQFLSAREQPDDEEEEGTDSTRRAIIFDQFEELFSFYPERWKEREDFFRQVAEILTDPALRVLFAMREDYLASLTPYASLLPERLRTRYRLERLRAEAAQQAVEKPLQDTGYSFADGVAASLVQELLNIKAKSVTDEMVDVPGEYVEPVQLQVVCQNLWLNLPSNVEVITADHLQSFGDVEEALRSFYERAIETAEAKSGVNKDDLRRWFHEQLITPVGTRGTVFRGDEQTGGILNSAVDMLEDQHIIRAEMRSGARWYELTHDRLIEPIRKANEAWHEEEQKRRIEEERRRVRAEEQARTIKRFRRLTAALVVLFLAAAAISVFAVRQRQEAVRQGQEAVRQGQEAEEQRQVVVKQKDRLEYALEQTKIANEQLIKERLTLILLADNVKEQEVPIGRIVYDVAVTPGGKYAISGSWDKTLRVWDIETWECIRTLTGHTDSVFALAVTPDGKYVISASKDKTLRVWDIETWECIRTLKGYEAAVTDLAVTPYGRRAIFGLHNGEIRVWDTEGDPNEWESVKTLGKHEDIVWTVAVTPDSKYAISGSKDKTLRVWDIEKGRPIETLKGHEDTVNDVAVTPDGKYAISSSNDKTLRVWDIKTWKYIRTLKGHKKAVRDVAITPDGKSAISGSVDKTLRVWNTKGDPNGWELVKTLEGHEDIVSALAVTPNGKYAISGSYDRTLRVWSLEKP
jgi:WD40 repeat protein